MLSNFLLYEAVLILGLKTHKRFNKHLASELLNVLLLSLQFWKRRVGARLE